MWFYIVCENKNNTSQCQKNTDWDRYDASQAKVDKEVVSLFWQVIWKKTLHINIYLQLIEDWNHSWHTIISDIIRDDQAKIVLKEYGRTTWVDHMEPSCYFLSVSSSTPYQYQFNLNLQI